MLVGYVGSSDTSATANNINGSVNAPQTGSPQSSPHNLGNLARFVSEHAFEQGGSSTPSTISTAPGSTFGSNPDPSYDPGAPADLSSNNGRVAANGLLRLEQSGLEYTPQAEAQMMAQTLGQHKNDPQ